MAKAAKTKKASKEKSKFFIIEKLQDATDEVVEKVKDYNDKYLAKAVDKGKETVKEYNEKYVAKPLEKGKNTLKEYNEKYVVKPVKKGKDYFEEPYKKFADRVDDMLARGRDIERDALDKLEEFVDNGKKFAYKIPMVETIGKKVTGGLNALPGIVNMPNRGEIEKLTVAMEKLNANLKSLNAVKSL